MSDSLKGKRIAILATDGFEQVELTQPMEALRAAGADVELISPTLDNIQGMHHDQPGEKFSVDYAINQVDSGRYDGLVLPGGVANPDSLRTDPRCIEFIRDFFEQHKPVAAICHGPWTLIEADVVRGRKMTSWPSLRTDLLNAGAEWLDQECVVDDGLITSRKPDDLPAFCGKLIEEFIGGHPVGQTT
ncbi:type 1 glutamine amidotransferase [Blastopirellula sp. J2-11]|uniref:type 1 glutamine amidotransferase domain-containing protein n=1 Tax=Blastopirellula sp. J2-11 TaxID=2943192 RepID=UPI0021C9B916|nr:type 1 glutamine amidotransferase domain-containing protein [Blastopirellula sp. J2-11]UUO05613.1 type 1 glutamine amidotransferase [Blastopirellula sp. J2-11]